MPRRAASLPYLSLMNVSLVRLAAQAHSVMIALVALCPIRNEASVEQSGMQQLAYPCRVLLVSLVTRHILDVLGIHNQQSKAGWLKDVDSRLPIYSRAFHCHMSYTQFQQPFFQFCQRSCRRFKLTRLTRYAGPLDCGCDYLLVYIQSATPVNDLGKFNCLIHCASILVSSQSYGYYFSFSLASSSGHENFILLS